MALMCIHTHVRHDTFACVPCLTRDSFVCVTWLFISLCITVLRCGKTGSFAMTHSYIRHDSFVRVAWLIRMCDITHLHVWHDSFACVIWLVRMSKPVHTCTWHESFISGLIQLCENRLEKTYRCLYGVSTGENVFLWFGYVYMVCERERYTVSTVVSLNGSCHTCELVTLSMSHVTHRHASRCQWVMSHMWMRHAAPCVVSRTWKHILVLYTQILKHYTSMFTLPWAHTHAHIHLPA